VLTEILGVPAEDKDFIIGCVDRMIGNADPDLSDVLLDSAESEKYRLLPFRSPAAQELFDYGHRLAADRRGHPRDDLVTKLVEAEVDGERLSEREFDTMFLLLVTAGNETTRHAIAHGMLTLIEHPDQMHRLREDWGLMPTEIEEILRWGTPVLHFRRTATREVEMRGQLVRAGDKLVTWYISANRDEEVFADPYRFDVGRKPNDHVTFGRGGPHFCLVSSMARLEMKVMFEELLPRLDGIELEAPVQRMRSNWSNALKRMPVRVQVARGKRAEHAAGSR
jgi:cytochrome P450